MAQVKGNQHESGYNGEKTSELVRILLEYYSLHCGAETYHYKREIKHGKPCLGMSEQIENEA